MCFFFFSVVFSIIWCNQIPSLLRVSHPNALSNATSIFMTRTLIYYLNQSCVWEAWRVCFSPSLYLHLPLPKACSFQVGSYIPVERTHVKGDLHLISSCYPFAMPSSLSEKQNSSLIASLPCLSLAWWFLFYFPFSLNLASINYSSKVCHGAHGKFHGTLFTPGKGEHLLLSCLDARI